LYPADKHPSPRPDLARIGLGDHRRAATFATANLAAVITGTACAAGAVRPAPPFPVGRVSW
jgi:hypothetical protein